MTIGFTGSPLVRAEHARHDSALFADMAGDPRALRLELAGDVPLIAGDRLAWAPHGQLPLSETLLLGEIEGIPRLARIDPAAPPARRTPELMAALATLAPGEAETYAVARSVLDWHARHRFCANCGAPTVPDHAGWARHCPSCGTEHFPRTDPVVIMLAEHGGRVLVGRQPAFPPRRYSALAGFVEPGESIEEAVARELREEAGVRTTNVRYVASQPWPFPSQLMIACLAEVADDRLTIDYAELEDARWVTRDAVAAALAGHADAAFEVPPSYAIAHTLFTAWLGSD